MVLYEGKKAQRQFRICWAAVHRTSDCLLMCIVAGCGLYPSSTKRLQLGLEAPWAVGSMNLGVFFFTFYVFLFDCSEDAFSTPVPQSWELETISFLCSQDQTAEAVEETKYQRPSVESWEPAMLTSFPLWFYFNFHFKSLLSVFSSHFGCWSTWGCSSVGSDLGSGKLRFIER